MPAGRRGTPDWRVIPRCGTSPDVLGDSHVPSTYALAHFAVVRIRQVQIVIG